MEMDKVLLEYCLNAMFLVPVVAGAAWLLVKGAGLRPAGEHRIGLGAMLVCLTLPAAGIHRPQVEIANSAPPLGLVQVRAEQDVSANLPATFESFEAPNTTPSTRIERETALPLQRLRVLRDLREIPMNPRAIAWFGWVYASVVGFAACRLARSWWAAARLVHRASDYAMGEAEDAVLRGLADRFGVRLPRVLLSPSVRGPVVTGVWRTVLLLPLGFAACPAEERRAALCHELAHVRRRDCLVHAGVQVLMLPLVWHPALHLVARRIARTREMACDEMAAAIGCHTDGGANELTYARCLLNLARTMSCQAGDAMAGAGLGLFRSNKLEERMMRLTEVKRQLTVRQVVIRRVGGIAVAGAVLVAGMVAHVAPVVAQQSVAAVPAAAIAPEAAPQSAEGAPAAVAAAPMPSASSSSVHRSGTKVRRANSIGRGWSGTSSGLPDLPGALYGDGEREHVMVKDGSQVHRWTGADGSKYEVRDGQAAPYTREQERAAEAEYKQRMVQARSDIAKAEQDLNSPEFEAQVEALSSKASADAMVKAQAMVAQAARNFDSPEMKAQMAELNSPQFKAQIEALRGQVAQLSGKLSQDRLDSLETTLGAQIALAERKAELVDTPEMQRRLDAAAKRLDEASARLDAATKALAEAQKRLQATPSK